MKRFHDRDTAFHAWATTATPIGIAEVVKGAQIRSWSHVFTVETIWLRRLYVLFFIELGSRRVRVAGCTPNPNAPWVIQQARQLSWTLAERSEPIRFLIRDRDNKFTDRFDDVFRSDGIEIVRSGNVPAQDRQE